MCSSFRKNIFILLLKKVFYKRGSFTGKKCYEKRNFIHFQIFNETMKSKGIQSKVKLDESKNTLQMNLCVYL